MDLGTLVRLVLRRWYVAGPILAITAVLAFQTYQSVRPTYEGVGQVLLLAPNVRFDDTELNPYASFDRGIDVTAQAMALKLTSSDSREALAAEGLVGAYTIAPAESGPILLIRTRSRNPDMALDTLDGVVVRLRDVLAEAQVAAGAPDSQLITVIELSISPRPNVLYAARDRSLAAIVGLGVVAAIASVLVVESLADRRRRQPDDPSSGPMMIDEAGRGAGDPPVHGVADHGVATNGAATLTASGSSNGVTVNGDARVPVNGHAPVPATGSVVEGDRLTSNGTGRPDSRRGAPSSGGRSGRSDGPLSEWLS